VHILRSEAARRGTTLIQVDPESVTEDEIRRFPYIAFKENVAIALALAELVGIDRATALSGMLAARPDPGTLAVDTYRAGNRRIAFANIFAANDPASTFMNINLLTERGLIRPPLNVVINCRPDRIDRNGQMGELTGRLTPQRIILIGEQTRSAKVAVPAQLADRVIDLGGPLDFTALIDAAVIDTNGDAAMLAIGNIHGQGEVLLERMHSLPSLPTAAVRTTQHRDPPTDPLPIVPAQRDRPSVRVSGHDQPRSLSAPTPGRPR